MHDGRVEAIFVASEGEGPMVARDSVHAVPGRGLEGDRYFTGAGSFSNKVSPGRQVTLIEAEAVDALRRDGIEVDASDTRRNIVTRSVPLNHLVDREFSVGEVRLRGVKLCEPCAHLERVSGMRLKDPLVHRGGLNAEVLTEGIVRVGDIVVATEGA